MSDQAGWPDEERKKALLAAATRMRDACQWGGPPEDWLPAAEAILDTDFADLVAARVEAAAVAMRAICARAAMVELGWNNGSVEARKAIAMQAAHTVNAIRERPIPSSGALAAALAQARKEGMEEAAALLDAVPRPVGDPTKDPAAFVQGVTKERARMFAAAIRAKAQEPTP